MSHDLLAELDGYRAELSGYDRAGRAERSDAVRAEIDRVTKAIEVEADNLTAQAENHEEAGQDVLAAQCRVEARRLRRCLAETPPAGQTAADSTPRETATTKRSRGAAKEA